MRREIAWWARTLPRFMRYWWGARAYAFDLAVEETIKADIQAWMRRSNEATIQTITQEAVQAPRRTK